MNQKVERNRMRIHCKEAAHSPDSGTEKSEKLGKSGFHSHVLTIFCFFHFLPSVQFCVFINISHGTSQFCYPGELPYGIKPSTNKYQSFVLNRLSDILIRFSITRSLPMSGNTVITRLKRFLYVKSLYDYTLWIYQ